MDAVQEMAAPMEGSFLQAVPNRAVGKDVGRSRRGAVLLLLAPLLGGCGDSTAPSPKLRAPQAPTSLLSDGSRLLRLSDPAAAVRDLVPSEAPAAWRGLDVVLAHKGLIEGLWSRTDGPGSVLIAHTVEDALRTAAERDGVALLLRPPSPAHVAAVARAGARMPRKSTLFVPKPRTGLVLRPLAD